MTFANRRRPWAQRSPQRGDPGRNFVNAPKVSNEELEQPMASDLVAIERRLWAAADQLWDNTGLKPAEFSTPVFA